MIELYRVTFGTPRASTKKMILRIGFLFAALGAVSWGQKVELVAAEPIHFPGLGDSNSPIHWHNGQRYVYNSDGQPIRSEGVELGRMRYARGTYLTNSPMAPWWMEATYMDQNGTLYGWYHHEMYQYCPMKGDRYIGIPVIGAAVSHDNGRTFEDLGFVLADGNEPVCEAKNGFFASGHGDFSVILDREKKWFYFFFTAYGGPAGEQGVAVARMAFGDLGAPAGQAWKYFEGRWDSPGIGGKVTPIFQVRTPWDTDAPDAFWGPSIHYNRELGEFVMLLNRACCEPDWPSEGIYVSFNGRLEEPRAWSDPERLMEGGGWYPMAVGLESGDTDKEAGAKARFFLGSDSQHELIFRKGQAGVAPSGPQRSEPRGSVETRRRSRRTLK
jgi:hypothetical protein